MIRVSINYDNYNWANPNEKQYLVTVRLDDKRIYELFDFEPDWDLPSDLIDLFEEKVNRTWYTGNKQEEKLSILQYWRENRNRLDVEYCKSEIESLEINRNWLEMKIKELKND